MFRSLTLTNFRQHRDAKFLFQNGVVAILGANEAGKSSIFEAIGYAMFGSKALRDPFEQVVTYDERPGSLRVELQFEVNGKQFWITRSKSGAELSENPLEGPMVTGQDAVTGFVENLLGAPAKIVMDLMFANQTKLRGSLQEGPSASVKLIEVLANFSLIDEIIALVQEKLSTGSTATVEERIQMLSGAAADAAPDVAPAKAAHERAASRLLVAQQAHTDATEAVTAHAPAAALAREKLSTDERLRGTLAQADVKLSTLNDRIANFEVPAAPEKGRIEALRKAVADAEGQAKVLAAHKAVMALGAVENEWEGDKASLVAEMEKTRAEIAAFQNAKSEAKDAARDAKIKVNQLEAQLIREETCGLCGKDLSDVPEVVQKNSALAPRIEAAKAEIAQADADAQKAQEGEADKRDYLEALVDVMDAHASRQGVLDRHSAYVTEDTAFVPHRFTWTGGSVEPIVNPSAELQKAEQVVAARERATGQLAQLEAQLSEAKQETVQLREQLVGVQDGLTDASETMLKVAQLNEAVALALQDLQAAKEALQVSAAELRTAQSLLDMHARQEANRKSQLAQAEQEFKDIGFNNALLKKLRGARPIIADKLWNMVLASVSHYFSAIRGFPSKITRGEGGFLVDGKVIGGGGLSGSALDALGLAIRVALTRTFLPNTQFFILDEPAAAADEQRELNMLGLISTSEFDQILLVTHSQLANSFAAQIVEI